VSDDDEVERSLKEDPVVKSRRPPALATVRIRQNPRQIEPMPGVLKQVIGSMLEREFENGKRAGVKMTDYKEKNIWGECVADYQTFLWACPDLTCLELISAIGLPHCVRVRTSTAMLTL
jgi:hypothetical protein